MRAYIVVSLLTGARTEELRALTWSHVDLNGGGRQTAEHSAVAVGAGWWRDKDEAIPPNLGAAGAMRRRAARASAPPARPANSDGGAVG
jgi:integrase